MRAAIFNGAGRPITVEQLPDPIPRADGVVVKVGRCGICGSDIAMTSGGPFDYPTGCQIGHEYGGEVVAVGGGVERLKVGDKVACVPNGFCGRCDACREGRLLACTAGQPQMGGMAEYIAVTEASALRLPDSLSLADGAMVEPMACGRRALRMARIRKGESVLVMGAGSLALSVIYWARLMGAAGVTVLSRSDSRRDSAMAVGATAFYSSEKDGPEAIERVAALAPDIVAECVGKADLLQHAIDYVRPGGRVLSMGMCMQPAPVIGIACTFKDVQLLFPLGYNMEDFAETARTFDAGAMDPRMMVERTVGLDSIHDAFSDLRGNSGRGKILVDPWLR